MASVAPAVTRISVIGVEFQTVEPPLVSGDGLAKLQGARARWVLVASGPDGGNGRLGHLHGAVLVREALTQVDGAGPLGQGRHLGEHSGAEAPHPRYQIHPVSSLVLRWIGAPHGRTTVGPVPAVSKSLPQPRHGAL